MPVRTVDTDTFIKLLSLADEDHLVLTWCAYGQVTPDWTRHDRELNEHLLYYVIEGNMAGEVDSQPVSARAFDMIWTSSHARHSFAAAAHPTVQYTVRFRFQDDGHDLRLDAPLITRTGAPELQEQFERLYIARHNRGKWQAARYKALILDLVIAIFGTDRTPERVAIFSRTQLISLDAYLDAHIHQNPSPQDLASLFGWTSDYFSRRFRRHFGMPPRTWLTQERIRRAEVLLLESDLSIQQVALRVGYDNQRFFATQFRRLNGTSPRGYRQSH